MQNWYKCEFRTGGFCITSLKSPVLLDLSHVLHVSWSLSGLIVRDKVPECEVRYADGTTIFLDNQDVLLSWEMLEKGYTEFIINGKVKAKCVVHKMSSFEDWETYKQDLTLSDAASFDLWVRMMLLLEGTSIDVITSDIEWLDNMVLTGVVEAKEARHFIEVFRKHLRDLSYRELFSFDVYDKLSKGMRRQVRKAVQTVYDHVLSPGQE